MSFSSHSTLRTICRAVGGNSLCSFARPVSFEASCRRQASKPHLNIDKHDAGASYSLPTMDADKRSKKAYKCCEKSAVLPVPALLLPACPGAMVCMTLAVTADMTSSRQRQGA